MYITLFLINATYAELTYLTEEGNGFSRQVSNLKAIKTNIV